jgi:hypothetical protein
MRIVHAVIAAGALMLALVMPAGAAPAGTQENISFTLIEASSTTAKVADVDYGARTVTLQGEDGTARVVKVGDDVRNFGQVRKGDTVTMDINQTVKVEVQPGGGEPMNIGSESQTSAAPGLKPGGVRTIEGKLKTRVESIDYDARTVTFKNRSGKMTTYKFGKDAKRFDEVRRGDMLVIEYEQTTAVSVK